MNKEIKGFANIDEKIANELFNRIFALIDKEIGEYTLDNYYHLESEIDYEKVRELILLKILKLK